MVNDYIEHLTPKLYFFLCKQTPKLLFIGLIKKSMISFLWFSN